MLQPILGTASDIEPSKNDRNQAERQSINQGRVRFDDLDLSHMDDVRVVYRRIRAAADSICSPLAHTHKLSTHRKWIDCRALAVENAVAEIDHPLLNEYHRKSTAHLVAGA